MTSEQFLAFARLFPEPLLLLSLQGQILACNSAVTTLLGRRYGELQGKQLAELVATSPHQVARYLRDCSRTSDFVPGALTFAPYGGRPALHCRCKGARVYTASLDNAGGILLRLEPAQEANRSFLMLNQQIDALRKEVRQRRRAEEAERAQREFFQVTLASIGDAVIVTDPSGVVTFLNSIAEELTGWTTAEAKGKPLPEVFHIVNEETHQPVESPVAKVLRTSTVAGLANHTVLVTKEGREIPIDDSAAPIRDAQGRLLGIVLVFRDITKRRQAEQALRDSEARYRRLFESIDEGFCVFEPVRNATGEVKEFRYVEANPAFAAHTGQGDVVGKTIRQAFPGEPQAWIDTYLAVLNTGEPKRFERALMTHGRVLDLYAFRITDGSQPRVAVLFQDITVRKQAEAERERLLAELQRINTELQQFAYIVSHDLNEPLRTMRAYVQLLARRARGKLDGATEEYMTFVTDAAQRMQQMLTDLLAYTRAGQTLELQGVDCEAVLSQVLKALQAQIREREARITHDPLPTVQGDATRLGQVLQNLLSNALKFCDEKPPCIHVSAVKESQHWRFSVRDNGIGIVPQQVGKLFQMFQRAHGKEYAGTGMGLAICKKIIEQHGGRIWVDSRPGEGSIFYFTIQDRL